jgi:hypothetical protein
MRSNKLTSPILRRPQKYPFPDLPACAKPIIVEAIHAAWQRIVEHADRSGGRLSDENEDVLTTRLEQTLYDIQTEPDHPSGFSASIFQEVVRDAAVTNYDDSSLKKRPDLTFRLQPSLPDVVQSPNYGLFVECKLVGPKRKLSKYCKHGLLRFVVGEYAWAMPCGMMVGYACEGFTVESKLIRHLKSMRGTSMNLRFLPRPAPTLSRVSTVFESGHGRTWRRDGKSHGDITVLHLWLPLRCSC